MIRPVSVSIRCAVFVALGVLPLASGAQAQMLRPEKAKLSVLTDRTAYEAGTTVRVAARVSIEPEWHVNSHKPTFDYLIPTELTFELPAGWPKESMRYPKDKVRAFAFADKPLAVYEGDVAILSEVRIPAGTAAGAFPHLGEDRKSTRLNSSHYQPSRMPSSA